MGQHVAPILWCCAEEPSRLVQVPEGAMLREVMRTVSARAALASFPPDGLAFASGLPRLSRTPLTARPSRQSKIRSAVSSGQPEAISLRV